MKILTKEEFNNLCNEYKKITEEVTFKHGFYSCLNKTYRPYTEEEKKEIREFYEKQFIKWKELNNRGLLII